MATQWKVEAWWEQNIEMFERSPLSGIFDKSGLYPPLFTSAFSNSSKRTLLQTVRNVIFHHLRAPQNFEEFSSEEKIVEQIIKAVSDVEAESNGRVLFEVSFTLIVTNQRVNNMLCKIPIFVVEVGNQCLFIDVKSSVYKSWNAFLKSNDLPACEFCYPVNGKYSDKFRFNYAKSPASTSGPVQRNITFGHKVMSAVYIAGTFFFKMAKCALECVKILAPIAKKLVPALAKTALINVRAAVEIVQLYKSKKIGIIELSQKLFELLQRVYTFYTEEVLESWVEIRKCLGSAYAYLNGEFGFESSPSSILQLNQNGLQASDQVIAVTYKTDSEFKDINKRADIMMVQASVQWNETGSNSTNEKERGQPATPMLRDPFVQKLLAQSKADYDSSCMNKEVFTQETRDLVKISANIAKHIQGTHSEFVHADILETLSDKIKKTYKTNINNYLKTLKAAEQGAGHKINKAVFNAALGIDGDYKEYFWNKTFLDELSSHGPKLGEQIKIKIEQMKTKQQIMIHPLTQQGDATNCEGLFLWKSHLDICDKDILCALQENIGLNIKEEDLVINHTTLNTIIRNQYFLICVYQNAPKVHEGLILIQKL